MVSAQAASVPRSCLCRFTNTRTEWERVKPYNDRLKVKLGPLEVLDF